MKLKKYLSVFVCLVTMTAMLTSCGGKKEFRNTSWGASLSSVTKSEDTEYVFASDDIIYFNDKMFDVDSEILYSFKDSALVEAQSKFLVSEWVLEDIIANYKEVAAQLTEKYGKPLNDNYQVWKTDSDKYEEYKNDTEFNAMYWKILEFKYEWKTESSYYSLSLNYKDEQINYVFYGCPVESAPVN
ncbi:MAG: hypothetical protein RSD35_05045 [Oscillospiraceae bacterium]